ncbi:MAG: hypothetical protein HYV07_32590 [Deltaproteobacteria bacterium]|nr:hypothetical protein [Deltaproteobacteria bacterium]
MSRRALALGLLVGAGCIGQHVATFEDIESYSSGVLFLEHGGRPAAYAFSVPSLVSEPIELNHGEAKAASLFEQSLEELGLREGELAPATQGLLAWEVPAPDASFVRGPSGYSWDEVADRPAETHFWIRGPRPRTKACKPNRKFTIRALRFPRMDVGWKTNQVRLDDGSMFVPDADGGHGYFYRATADEIVQIKDLPDDLPHDAVVSDGANGMLAASCPDDPLVRIVPEDIEAGKYRVEGDARCTLEHGLPETVVRLSGGMANGKLEVFGLGRAARLYKYGDDLGPVKAVDLGLGFVVYDFLTWVGPDEVMSPIHGTLGWYRAGAVVDGGPRFLEPGEAPIVTRVVRRSDGNAILIAQTGALKVAFYVYAPWTGEMMLSELEADVGSLMNMTELEDGSFLYVGQQGVFGTYSPATGFCRLEPGDATFEGESAGLTPEQTRVELAGSTLYNAAQSQPNQFSMLSAEGNTPGWYLFWAFFDP